MSKLLLFFITFTSILLFSSCDNWGRLYYQIRNDTNEPVTIIYQNDYYRENNDSIILTIPPNTEYEHQLLEISELIAKKFPEKADDVEFRINVFSVKKGTTPSVTDFSKKSEWDYYTIDKEEAAYKLILKNEDFSSDSLNQRL